MSEPKRCIIVDINASLSSPSMKGVVRALPVLRANGWKIEVWCWNADPSIPCEEVKQLPRFLDLPFLRYHVFGLVAKLYRRMARRDEERFGAPPVYFSVAPFLPESDAILVQFSSFDWLKRQKILGVKSVRDWIERLITFLSAVEHRWLISNTTAKFLVCVSRAVANDFCEAGSQIPYRILPNSYDPTLYNRSCVQYREQVRQNLGIPESAKVFLFVAHGHFRRKGLLLACQAIKLCRRRDRDARLLVVGGTAGALTRLETILDGEWTDWRDWLHLVGMSSQVERYMGASDGFLFPSYSEAFALVEVEANACGLPLFLTRHHGSEMVMIDGENGRYVPFEPLGIADVLESFMAGQWKPAADKPPGGMNSDQYSHALLGILEDLLSDRNVTI